MRDGAARTLVASARGRAVPINSSLVTPDFFLLISYLKLARLPAYSLLPSSLYVLCRASHALHSSFLLPNSSLLVYLAAFNSPRIVDTVTSLGMKPVSV